ncbi:MAG: glycosyltransferase family 2 protein [Planctomycetaceae bacterium]|nr:glycosyltransferase family 2 protein [Planctomycetaceae bacterium]
MMHLTIGMATFRDNDLLWATLARLRDAMAAVGLASRVELLVVDNEPDGRHGKLNESLCRSLKATYVPFPSPVGTGPPRDEVVSRASGEWVLCMDSHVMLCEGVLPRLYVWTLNNPSRDLHHGVLMQSRLVNDDGSPAINWTHWEPRWGEDGMFGKAARHPAAMDPDLPPFAIPHSGMGLFLARKDAWLGFHPRQRHFGCEGYVPIKYYQHGRQVWCQPWLRWVHHFRDETVAAPFPTDWRSRAANYLHFWKELAPCAIRLEDIRKAHVQPGRVTEKTWRAILGEIGIDPIEAARRDGPRMAAPMNSPNASCRHRGPEIDRRTADLCGLRGQLYVVHACAIHGECVLHRTCRKQLERTCLNCGDFAS